jgi:hypothetical protein
MLSKCKKLFHKSYDIVNKLLVIIHVDKWVLKNKNKNFSNRTSSFSSLLLWNPKCTLINFNIIDTRINHHFSTKKNPGSCKISKTNCFKITLKQFLFSKCNIKISKFILDKDFFIEIKPNKKGVAQSHCLSESLTKHTKGQ